MIPLLAGLAVIAAYLTFVAVRVRLRKELCSVLWTDFTRYRCPIARRECTAINLYSRAIPADALGCARGDGQYAVRQIERIPYCLHDGLSSRHAHASCGCKTCRSRCDLQGESFRHPLASSECRQSGWDCVHYQWQVQCGSPRPVSQRPGSKIIISDVVTLRRVLSAGGTFAVFRIVIVAEEERCRASRVARHRSSLRQL